MKKDATIDRMIQVLRRKHYALKTERSYIGWACRYIDFLLDERPEGDSAKKMETFLTRIALDDGAAGTQNQAFYAILFLYEQVLQVKLGNVKALRAKVGKRHRHAPSVKQVRALLDCVQDRNGYPTRLVTFIIYACGLRVSEPLELRIKDLDLDAGKLVVRCGKGDKDRVVCNIPPSLRPQIEAQMQVARGIWERDRASKLPVQLPGRLARKYPSAQFAWGWAFLFPGHDPCEHPRQGHMCRYRMHEANVQRAVRAAAISLGLEGILTPHHLRHGYGTHLMDRGVNPRDIQEAMGHNSLETTMLYCHPEAARVPSPLTYLEADSA